MRGLAACLLGATLAVACGGDDDGVGPGSDGATGPQGDACRAAALRAAGATAVVAKPTSGNRDAFAAELVEAVRRAAARAEPVVSPSAVEPRVIAIGASTGGASATAARSSAGWRRCPRATATCGWWPPATGSTSSSATTTRSTATARRSPCCSVKRLDGIALAAVAA